MELNCLRNQDPENPNEKTKQQNEKTKQKNKNKKVRIPKLNFDNLEGDFYKVWV